MLRGGNNLPCPPLGIQGLVVLWCHPIPWEMSWLLVGIRAISSSTACVALGGFARAPLPPLLALAPVAAPGPASPGSCHP